MLHCFSYLCQKLLHTVGFSAHQLLLPWRKDVPYQEMDIPSLNPPIPARPLPLPSPRLTCNCLVPNLVFGLVLFSARKRTFRTVCRSSPKDSQENSKEPQSFSNSPHLTPFHPNPYCCCCSNPRLLGDKAPPVPPDPCSQPSSSPKQTTTLCSSSKPARAPLASKSGNTFLVHSSHEHSH